MEPGSLVKANDIEAMLKVQGLSKRGLQAGDVLYIYTGWSDNWSGGLFTVTNGSSKLFYVQVGAVSDTFTWASGNGPYTNKKGTPATLEKSVNGISAICVTRVSGM